MVHRFSFFDDDDFDRRFWPSRVKVIGGEGRGDYNVKKMKPVIFVYPKKKKTFTDVQHQKTKLAAQNLR